MEQIGIFRLSSPPPPSSQGSPPSNPKSFPWPISRIVGPIFLASGINFTGAKFHWAEKFCLVSLFLYSLHSLGFYWSASTFLFFSSFLCCSLLIGGRQAGAVVVVGEGSLFNLAADGPIDGEQISVAGSINWLRDHLLSATVEKPHLTLTPPLPQFIEPLAKESFKDPSKMLQRS